MEPQNIKYLPPPQKGFTLVETLVAIFVMLMAIVAPMTIASQALSTARFAKEQVTAFYLAQEGIELVRNIRDNNALSGGLWNGVTLSTGGCYNENGCYIDAKELTVNYCNETGNKCPTLKIDNDGIYTYPSGTPSQFTRTIKITPKGSNEISVSVKISWVSSTFSATKEFTITDELTNWQ